MSSDTYQILRDAILNKQNIEADYKGYHRVMTPHTLGLKENREQCLCYQFNGESSSATTFPENSPKNWRCVIVSELRKVAVVSGQLHTCDTHTQRQSCIDTVDVEEKF